MLLLFPIGKSDFLADSLEDCQNGKAPDRFFALNNRFFYECLKGARSAVKMFVMSHSGQILIVEDNRDCLQAAQKVLEREGYSVRTAMNVDDGLALLRTNRFDLVVCDYRMPGKTGLDLFNEIKRQGWETAVLMITADANTAAIREAREAGALQVIDKPVRRNELLGPAADVCDAAARARLANLLSFPY